MKASKSLLKAVRAADRMVKLAEVTTVQSVIVKKGGGMSLAKARTIAQGFGRAGDVDETGTSWRFRQRDPGDFKKDSFVIKQVNDHVSIVLGKLK